MFSGFSVSEFLETQKPVKTTENPEFILTYDGDICNNVQINKSHKWKATFATRRGSFEPLVMFFCMTNSPPTFQNMVNNVLKDVIDNGIKNVRRK